MTKIKTHNQLLSLLLFELKECFCFAN